MHAPLRHFMPATPIDAGNEERSAQFVFESILRLATVHVPQFEELEPEGLPESPEYLPAALDDFEPTTTILAKPLEITVRSAASPSKARGLRDVLPTTLRLPRRVAQRVDWRAAFGAFLMTLSIGLVALGVALFLLPRVRWAPPRAVALTLAPNDMLLPPRAPATAIPSPESALSAAPAEAPTLPAVVIETEPATAMRPIRESSQPAKAKLLAATTSAAASGSVVQTGQVFLTTPGGGEVFEKGRWLGRAPASFELNPGWHTLVIKAGDQDRIATVQVRENDSIMVSVPARR